MELYRFTPVAVGKYGVRAEMKIDGFSQKVFHSVRGTKKWVCVRDYVNNKNYMVMHAACNIPRCLCDAVYKEM